MPTRLAALGKPSAWHSTSALSRITTTTANVSKMATGKDNPEFGVGD